MEQEPRFPPWERPSFLIVITLVGGYMNAYTYMTRDGVLANMHTANMSHLGIHLALGNWYVALTYFLPIVSCILGAAFSEFLKALLGRRDIKGDWRKAALLLESAALFLAGCVPLGVMNMAVTLFVSFFMGFQLCLFRTCMGTAHNTTICTGNIRNVGQKLYKYIAERDRVSLKILCTFAALTFSFSAGAVPGTLCSLWLSEKAVWLCSAVLLGLCLWMYESEKKTK